MAEIEIKENCFAAIDLGSNSFHMVIAEPEGDSIRIIDSLRLPVRLGAGLDKHKNIKPATEEAALSAIGQFAQRLQGVPRQNVRVVGTNTLRRAKNARHFIDESFLLLRKRIEIIAGREEARLIYSAVSHGLPAPERARLVIDIGGGSTELIIGRGYSPSLMESINMGCVSYSNEYFADEKFTTESLNDSIVNAQLELQPLKSAYADEGWDEVIGCSGTIKATANALHELELTDGLITRSALKKLHKHMIKAGSMEKLNLQSISKSRTQVFSGGTAILFAIMETLDIEEMQPSQVALREGLIFELIGKAQHIDIQTQTIENLISRYHVDVDQATRVQLLASKLFDLIGDKWNLEPELDHNLIIWASALHEIGLSVAHSQYHKHGAYLMENSDLLGFSRSEQSALALLVRYHRRKLDVSAYEGVPESERERLVKLTIILRLAVLLLRSRHTEDLGPLTLDVSADKLKLSAPAKWFETHPLTTADLAKEAKHVTSTGFKLVVSSH